MICGPVKVVVVKRNRLLAEQGDFQVLLVPDKSRKTEQNQSVDIHECVKKHIQRKLVEKGIPLSRCSPADDGSIYIWLIRSKLFHDVISYVLLQKDKYGLHEHTDANCSGDTATNQRKPEEVLLNCCCCADEKYTLNSSLNSLRTEIISSHINALLAANGYQASGIDYIKEDGKDSSAQSCMKKLNLCSAHTNTSRKPKGSNLDILQKLKQSKYLKLKPVQETALAHCSGQNSWPDSQTSDRCEPCQSVTSSTDEVTRAAGDGGSSTVAMETNLEGFLNLGVFLKESNLPVGKHGYDSNLGLLPVPSSGSTVLQGEECLKAVHKCLESGIPVILIHIVPHDLEFSQQRVDIMLKMLFEETVPHLPQSHQICGTVTTTGLHEEVSAAEYLSVRRKQVEEDCQVKHGTDIKGELWEGMLSTLTSACVKFEMLGTHCKQKLKLNLDKDEHGTSAQVARSGVFVMYNYARLATLFRHFQAAVQNGTYPSLPPVAKVNFSLLREEEEWSLLFNSVWCFPEMVEGTTRGLDQGQLRLDIQTHKVAQFLTSLSHDVSAYYSRVHVLVEPRAHLLPLMFARLYLLKAVQQVMYNGLQLMGIEPLDQL